MRKIICKSLLPSFKDEICVDWTSITQPSCQQCVVLEVETGHDWPRIAFCPLLMWWFCC